MEMSKEVRLVRINTTFLSIDRNPNTVCNLRFHDPEFNKGKGDIFFRAFQRAIDRGDFK
jgi:hypothetical protein